MPFVTRSKSGEIMRLYTCRQHEGQEYLAEDNEELLSYFISQKAIENEKQSTERLIQAKIRGRAIAALAEDTEE